MAEPAQVVSVQMRVRELKALDRAAKQAQVTRSEFMRGAINAAVDATIRRPADRDDHD